MEAIAIQQKSVGPFSKTVLEKSASPRPISWKDFQRRYLSREDNFKYEWVDGQVEKTIKSMDKTQLFILHNLLNLAERLKFEGKLAGRLVPEADLLFLKNHRRPDFAWLTEEQIYRLATEENHVPAFVIEVISTWDQANLLNKKMVNYRDAGVQVVWQIFPETRSVHVFGGVGLRSMTVCSGDEICSAAPVLPDFEMPASAVFAKPNF